MAGSKKKRATEGGDNQQNALQETIQVDFEGRNPEVEDFHGIKQLLLQLFLKAHIDLSQMTDMIINQAGIGSVLRQCADEPEEDEEDDMDTDEQLQVFAISSILNLAANKNETCVKQLAEVLIDLSKKHADESVQAQVQRIMSFCRVGLLLNERFVNIPPPVVDPLLTALVGEIDRKKKKDPSYDFEYILMICKLHRKKGDSTTDEVEYSNSEEQLFAQHATYKFDFDVTEDSDTSSWTEDGVQMVPYRQVLFIDGNKLKDVIVQVKQHIQDNIQYTVT